MFGGIRLQRNGISLLLHQQIALQNCGDLITNRRLQIPLWFIVVILDLSTLFDFIQLRVLCVQLQEIGLATFGSHLILQIRPSRHRRVFDT